jgi:hypothetical protein
MYLLPPCLKSRTYEKRSHFLTIFSTIAHRVVILLSGNVGSSSIFVNTQFVS